MTIFFFILKIIGIILLVLVLTLLLLISLILFCPITYKLNGENNRLQYKVLINISWAFFVLRLRGGLDNESYFYQLKIFGYTLFIYPQKEKKEQENKQKSKNTKKKEQIRKKHIKESRKSKKVKESDSSEHSSKNIEVSQELTSNLNQSQFARIEQQENIDSRKDDLEPKSSEKAVKKPSKPNADLGIEEKKKYNRSKNILDSISLFIEKAIQKIKTLICKFKQIFENLRKSFKKAKDKIGFLKEKYQEVMKQIKDSKNQDAIKHLWKEIKYLFFHFRPRKIRGEALFGTSDPALTGQITGVICLFPYFYAYNIHILPDFESDENYLKSDFLVEGHVRLIHILCVGIRILFDKNIMKWIKKIL